MGIFYICYETLLRKQTILFLQTAEVWSTSSAIEVCRCGLQTADVLPLKKQRAPKCKGLFVYLLIRLLMIQTSYWFTA
ncbi:hypothetical protein Hanom_Chr12g01181491 [Helianthus anomalus]